MPAPMETPSLSDLATSPHPETTNHTYRACLKSNFLHGPYEDSNDPEESCFHHTNHGAASTTTIQTREVLWLNLGALKLHLKWKPLFPLCATEENAEESTSADAEATTPEAQVDEEELAGLAVVETE